MFTLRPSERQMPVNDVVAFIDLMHRWPFQTALKFAHEFYHGNLVGSWVNSWVRDGANYYVIISEGMCWEQNQAYACANLHRLTYLREDIERIEAQNPRYRDDVHDAMYDEFLLGRCTQKNVAQLAPEIYQRSGARIIYPAAYPNPESLGRYLVTVCLLIDTFVKNL